MMHVINVGVNHQVAPLDVREKLTFNQEEIVEAMMVLEQQNQVSENIILSTCNRTEIFAVVNETEAGIQAIEQFLKNWFALADSELPFLRHISDDQVLEHLFKLVTGLDSMVIGETQILGQVRDAFLTAQEAEMTGKIFNELFKRAITFAKRAHSHTNVSEQAVSVSYVAVELAKKMFGSIDEKHVAILGAGEMSELALKNLQGTGVSEITVVNRTLEKATEVAKKFQAKAVDWDELPRILQEADILISSTGADTPVLDKQSLQPVHKKRKGNPLFLIDIAVPRDIASDVSELDSVFVYDMDDLHAVVDENLEARKEAAALIEEQLVAEIAAFHNWVATLDAVPVIQALTEKSEAIQAQTLKSIHRKMPDLTEREKKVLYKHTKSIIHQLLEAPIDKAKQLGQKNADNEELELFKDIFNLDITETAEQRKTYAKASAKQNIQKSTS